MTVTTVYGRVAAIDNPAAAYWPRGSLREAHTFSSFAPTCGPNVRLDLDHDPARTVGEVVHVEVDDDGALHAVAVVDRCDGLADIERPIYYSGEFRSYSTDDRDATVWVGDGAELISLALTCDPLTIGAQPVTFLPFDVRSSRRGWPGRLPNKMLLDHAALMIETRRRGAPLEVFDHRRNTDGPGPWPCDCAMCTRPSSRRQRTETWRRMRDVDDHPLEIETRGRQVRWAVS